jgi:prophage DNA circulation protein
VSEARFDISLPVPYREKWREAYRSDKDDSPRLSSYQPPDGEPIPFIYKSLDFSGGLLIDTAEYPFFGLWSNETLNQKTQAITVHGYLRGEYYLQQRVDFLDALMIPTSDDSPGFFDHPLWGRFKVVVENYNISESANENGQCEITLTFKRAGVSLEARAGSLIRHDLFKPENAANTAVKLFAKINSATATLHKGFGVIKAQLLSITGTLQLPQDTLNGIVNEIAGVENLIAQGIQSPMLFAQVLVNSAFSIAAGAASVKESAQAVGEYFSGQNNNKRKTVLNFLAAAKWTLPIVTATVKEEETKKAAENLYRTISLCAAAKIMNEMEEARRNQMDGYWALYTRLENSISLEDPDVYKAVAEMRSALSAKLRQSAMNRELKRTVGSPVPLLFLLHHLGCDDNRLRAMNAIEDSFLISGEVSYV